MNEGKRPGGLTALAVLNFVFAGFGFLSLFGLIAFFFLIGMIPTEGMGEQESAQIEALQKIGLPLLIVTVGLSLISSVLLLTSGIGYIKQKKFLGRILGSGHGILTIISSIITGLLFGSELGGGFNIGTIINLIYPVLTLILLNTTFKDDLIN